MYRKALRLLLHLSLYALLVLGLLETGLRLIGYKPFEPVQKVHQPNGNEFDSDLGWVLIPGHYEIGPFNDVGDSMSITIKKDIGRVTRDSSLQVGAEQITLIGGSFMMGHGLDDDETAAWKLQQLFPQLDFRNLAVSGYGTYQSLLVLEDELRKGNRPKCVIYGAFQHHQLRNVAQGDWLMELNREVPYVTLRNDSTFERRGLTVAYNLRFRTRLATAYMAEKALNRMLSFKRVKDAQKLTQLLIKEMHRLCQKYDISFYVATLYYLPDDMKHLRPCLAENNINLIDCHVPLTLENIIKDDGHPGESVNDIWVERIADRLIADGITDSPEFQP